MPHSGICWDLICPEAQRSYFFPCYFLNRRKFSPEFPLTQLSLQKKFLKKFSFQELVTCPYLSKSVSAITFYGCFRLLNLEGCSASFELYTVWRKQKQNQDCFRKKTGEWNGSNIHNLECQLVNLAEPSSTIRGRLFRVYCA